MKLHTKFKITNTHELHPDVKIGDIGIIINTWTESGSLQYANMERVDMLQLVNVDQIEVYNANVLELNIIT